MSPRPESPMTRSTCPYCGVGCGVVVQPTPGTTEAGDCEPSAPPVLVSGDPEHPANRGRLCSKGAALAETLGRETRLLEPRIGDRAVSWDEALDHVARGFLDVIDSDGPEAVAFYVSGQLLTEDYYVANKLMKGFIGAANIDTNSRLCMSSAVAAHLRAFGADAVPGNYEDLELADLVVLAGSNLAWTHPVLFQRLQAARERRPQLRVVVIDPRRTATAEAADLHLALAPGTDGWLFNGLLHHLYREDRLDLQFLEDHVDGFAATLRAARDTAGSVPRVASACGLPEADVAQFFRWFAQTERTVTLFSQGINQSDSGTDKANAILNVHLATGRIGQPAQAPFSVTGQPNAMGGREVGGLANQLAAHMGFDDPGAHDRLRRFWRAPRLAARPGLKAVELFQAIESGRVKAVWIMGTNPAFSLPDAERVSDALRRCPLVVVSDCVADTETTRLADVRLPASAWGEKDGTVTNSERCISRQRAFLPPAGQARPDWWIVCEVARRMGFGSAFPYTRPVEIFREHARLSAFENHGERAFDIGALAGLGDAGYDSLAPVQWPVFAARAAAAPAIGSAPSEPDRAGRPGTGRFFSDGRFFHAGGRARLIPVVPQGPSLAIGAAFPLRMNTGRIRDHWHSMTRTALSARLSAHRPEPFVEIHPTDAAAHGIGDGQLARLSGTGGQVALLRARVTAAQPPGSVFVPMHWSAPQAPAARVNALVPASTDPISGQPAFKAIPVDLRPLAADWVGFLLSRERRTLPELPYRAESRGFGFFRYELAGTTAVPDWVLWADRILGSAGDRLEFSDQGAGVFRAARIQSGRLMAVLFIGPDPARLPPREALGQLFGQAVLDDRARIGLLSGHPETAAPAQGRLVCACHGVGEERIRQAIRESGLSTQAELADTLGAGTGCGSCIPELRGLLGETVSAAGARAGIP
ncbi:nitrate reductase [Thioalkalivibrio paradoxus]|uniref:Nitrate reductase n=1 Tax=Thioalkalivibrio paradoxus ARh 1 TaxID=713585 RepID=W0DLN6_9GAMM|nr:nitrate reductase [Thioalkalivibrio paradoxus]AHE97790.1 nitrate reductase [Thioalkalivibrio paradoxus ARh 1]